ncbi:DUF6214 family protein [Streptomyces hypolithicus]
MLESNVFHVDHHAGPNGPAAPAWFSVRLSFADGARIDVLAAVAGDRLTVEEVRADVPLGGFTASLEWAEEPLGGDCRVVAQAPPRPAGGSYASGVYDQEPSPVRRARPSWPGGRAGRRVAAQAYKAAQQAGQDPVLAVMCATGRSRRRSLKLIASARDEGHLTPRHNRR